MHGSSADPHPTRAPCSAAGDWLYSTFVERSPRDFVVLDGLRAWAVTWVLVYHCFMYGIGAMGPLNLSWLNLAGEPVLFAGDMGVDLFFILSGFLIANMLLHDFSKFNFWTFLYRRVLRIAPLLYFVLLLLLMGISSDGVQADECKTHWWNVALFLNNLVGLPSEGGGLNPCFAQTWSVAGMTASM